MPRCGACPLRASRPSHSWF
ncbi:hypothetical protein [Sphingomonas aquatilis]